MQDGRSNQWPQRIALCLLATLTVTGISLHLARLHKRLLNYPYYDDVAYFDDGWEKLAAYRAGGIAALIKSCTRPPPHSPFSTGLAMAAFAVFGRHEWPPYHGNGSVVPVWGPYAANGIIVLFLFLCVDWLMGPDRPWWQRGLVLLMVAVTRLPADIIWNFKPDAFWGIVTAAAVVAALRRPCGKGRHAALAGLLFGMALMAKPSISPLTIAVFFVTLFFWVIALRRENPEGGLMPMVRPLAICAATAIFICAPYIAVGGVTATYDYTFKNVLGESRQRWVLPLSPWGHATYFLFGDGGMQIIGLPFAVFFALLAVGFVRMRKVWRSLPNGGGVRIFGMTAAALVAYGVPTLETVKNQRFGVAFQSLVIFGAVMVLAGELRGWSKFGVKLLIGAAAACVILAIIPVNDHHRAEYWMSKNDPEVMGLNRLAERIYGDLHGVKVKSGDRTQVLLGVMDKAVNPATMQWLAYGDRPFNMLNPPDWGNPQSEAAAIRITHVFVTADPDDAPPDKADLIGPATERRLANEFLHRDDFRLIDSYRAFNGKTYYVFERLGI